MNSMLFEKVVETDRSINALVNLFNFTSPPVFQALKCFLYPGKRLLHSRSEQLLMGVVGFLGLGEL